MATKVPLLTAANFEILAGSGITIAGAVNSSVIIGDIGTSPTPSITGLTNAHLLGTNHANDAVTAQAKLDLTAAYLNAAGQAVTTKIADAIGGTTITPGVYDTITGTIDITGTVILDGQGDPNAVFIFKAYSTLITASSSNVMLINGAQACNVVWQVGSSATLGTSSQLYGDILALTSITANTSAKTNGRLLARNGAVTLDTNTVSLAVCSGESGGGAVAALTATVCNITALAAAGASFNGLDKTDYQAARLFLLAQAVYSVSSGAVDVRDICALATSMRQYDYLPDYARRSAALEVFSVGVQNLGITLTQQQVTDAIACSHCCTVTPQSLQSAEICLWNLMFQFSI
jgi:Ice-binding-like